MKAVKIIGIILALAVAAILVVPGMSSLLPAGAQNAAQEQPGTVSEPVKTPEPIQVSEPATASEEQQTEESSDGTDPAEASGSSETLEPSAEPNPAEQPEKTDAEIESEVEAAKASEYEASTASLTEEALPVANSVQPEAAVEVSTVDEFLSAIAPDTVIVLNEGVYELIQAADYGVSRPDGYYTWEDRYDGYQLVIRDVENLEIRGSGEREATVLSAIPRYANVLSFRDCKNLTVSDLTLGHTEEPGFCAGGVLAFYGCQDVKILSCGLFGCGTLGIDAENCRNLSASETEIYNCSVGAVHVTSCVNVTLDRCTVRDCGTKNEEYECYELFAAESTAGFALVNCQITGNSTQNLMNAMWSREVYLLGCSFANNSITNCAFILANTSPVVDGCVFTENNVANWYEQAFTDYAVNRDGDDLIGFDFEHMELAEASYDGPNLPEAAAEPEAIEREDGTLEFHVSTVDEFLSALGSDRTVYLGEGTFDLSTAANIGILGGNGYSWEQAYDGPGLVISGVRNLSIIGQGKEKTTILAVPRYADVLRFEDCQNVSVVNLTAGHTETGDCAGDVLSFLRVTGAEVDGCGLFGCGCWGICLYESSGANIRNTEIYSCRYGALYLVDTADVVMSDLYIHDMPTPESLYLYGCRNVTLDGKSLKDGDINPNA